MYRLNCLLFVSFAKAAPFREITNEVGNLEDYQQGVDSHDDFKIVDRGFLYYLVSNRNRKRLYKL